MSDLLRWRKVKTRKPHKCFGCCHEYPAGTMMVYAAYARDGSIWGVYFCETCEAYMKEHFESGDEIKEGMIYEDDSEGWAVLLDERSLK